MFISFRNVDYLLASGSDSGQFSVWDLRNISTSIPAASFTWHKAPITSISWHPTESSMLAVAGADDQLTIWDLALENDSEVKEQIDVPPQLLFIHQGQQHLKEIKHHPQIPGAIISTAYDGFNIFKTINS